MQLQGKGPKIDHHRAARSLQRGLEDIAQLMERTRQLPQTLLNAQVLVAPAIAIRPSEKRVTQRLRREHVHVNYTDVPDLVLHWAEACASINTLRTFPQQVGRPAPELLIE